MRKAIGRTIAGLFILAIVVGGAALTLYTHALELRLIHWLGWA